MIKHGPGDYKSIKKFCAGNFSWIFLCGNNISELFPAKKLPGNFPD